jgi:hypothetical protein
MSRDIKLSSRYTGFLVFFKINFNEFEWNRVIVVWGFSRNKPWGWIVVKKGDASFLCWFCDCYFRCFIVFVDNRDFWWFVIEEDNIKKWIFITRKDGLRGATPKVFIFSFRRNFEKLFLFPNMVIWDVWERDINDFFLLYLNYIIIIF